MDLFCGACVTRPNLFESVFSSELSLAKRHKKKPPKTKQGIRKSLNPGFVMAHFSCAHISDVSPATGPRNYHNYLKKGVELSTTGETAA